jgi:hypothetical protein
MSLELLLILEPGHPLPYMPHQLMQHSSPGHGWLLPILLADRTGAAIDTEVIGSSA